MTFAMLGQAGMQLLMIVGRLNAGHSFLNFGQMFVHMPQNFGFMFLKMLAIFYLSTLRSARWCRLTPGQAGCGKDRNHRCHKQIFFHCCLLCKDKGVALDAALPL